jgi:hypothetical protein
MNDPDIFRGNLAEAVLGNNPDTFRGSFRHFPRFTARYPDKYRGLS